MKTLLALILCSALPCFARLGETPSECTQRYGSPISVNKENQTLVFVMKDLQITAHFWEGKCYKLQFETAEHYTDGNAQPLSEAVRLTLLEANNGGGEWFYTGRIEDHVWHTKERGAFYVEPSNYLIVYLDKEDNEAREAKAAKAKAEAKAKLKGF
jgi:hypothetical protein